MAQKSMYFMKTCAITQGKNVGSHLGSTATDHGGAGTHSEKCYMPWDGRVVRCRTNANGECYVESLEPVEYPDGTVDYQKALFIHDSSFNVSVGQVLKQGEYFYDEGGMGGGNPNKFATHVHVEFGRGKWKSAKQFPNAQGTYIIEDQIDIEDAVFMPADIVFRKDANGNNMDGGLNWVFVDSAPTVDAKEGKHAVDLNDNQGRLDFAKIMNANKAKAIGIRTGYGSVKETQTDECFEYYVEQCIKYNLPMWFYNFSYAANTKDAREEADMVIELLKPYKEHIYLPVYYDFEEISARYLNKTFGMTVTKENVQDFTIAFCERLKEAGYIPGVYCNLNCYNLYYGDEFFKRTGYSFWYCRPGKPEPDKTCDIWQCAVNNGKHFGIDMVVDQNVIYLPLAKPVPVKPVEFVECNKQYKVLVPNCEYFNSADVNDVAGKFAKDSIITAYAVSEGKIGEYFFWFKTNIDGKEYYVALVEKYLEEVIEEPEVELPPVEETPVEPEVTPEEIPTKEPELPDEEPVEEEEEELPELNEEDFEDVVFDGVEPPVAEDSVEDEIILPPTTDHDHSIYDCLRAVAKWLWNLIRFGGK